MKRLLLAVSAMTVAAVATASVSSAADIPRKAPAYYPAPVLFTWTGFYVGLNGGYGWAKSDWSGGATTGSVNPKGWLVGGTVGYNLQTGVWVWGLEADAALSTIKGSTTGGTGVCGAAPGCETRNRWLGSARGRIGYAFDRVLPYITGGAAFGDVKMSPNTGFSETKTKFGWAAGAGVEYAFAGAWSAKLEYMYYDLGKSTCSAASCAGADTSVTFTTHTAKAGINYRF